MPIKAITLHQPYATAIVLGHKRHETRSWRTDYRGPLAIHAAKTFPAYARNFARTELTLGRMTTPLPLGQVLCIVELVDVVRADEIAFDVGAIERLYGDYSPGRWAWVFAKAIRVLDPPVPARGAQGLWTWDETVAA